METILRANRIPFKALDIATDEKARMLWGRRAGKDESGRARKMPGLVQMGMVIGVRLPSVPLQWCEGHNWHPQDLVEVEDWNEYGELKQHITIYYDEFTTPSKSAAPLPNPFAAKAPVSQPAVSQKENVQPTITTAVPETPKIVEQPKAPVGGQPTSFTLAMRQAGAEAAQIAKQGKKKVEALVGVGTAPEPTKEEDKIKKDVEKSTTTPSPIKTNTPHTIETKTTMQSPTSTAWKQVIHPVSVVAEHETEKFASMQSPTSTAWKPVEANPLISTYRGSSVENVSKECIKKVEDAQTIAEEEEEEDDDDEDDDDDDDDDDDEDDDSD